MIVSFKYKWISWSIMVLDKSNCILITALDIEQTGNMKAFESSFLCINSNPPYIKQKPLSPWRESKKYEIKPHSSCSLRLKMRPFFHVFILEMDLREKKNIYIYKICMCVVHLVSFAIYLIWKRLLQSPKSSYLPHLPHWWPLNNKSNPNVQISVTSQAHKPL